MSSVVESGYFCHGYVRSSGLIGIGIGDVPPWNVSVVWSSYPASNEIVGVMRVLEVSARRAEESGAHDRGGNRIAHDDPAV